MQRASETLIPVTLELGDMIWQISCKYDMGAICMLEHSEKLQNLVNDALEKGAEIAVRGSITVV
jgi:hypothetical protein